MADNNLWRMVKVVDAVTVAAGASASSAVNGAIIDMSGFTGVAIEVKTGPITAGAATSIKVQQDTDVAGGTMEDIAGTAQTIADDDDNQIFLTDIIRPAKRYVRVVISRATQVATVTATYFLYGPDNEPVTQTVANLVTVETFVNPIAGTA